MLETYYKLNSIKLTKNAERFPYNYLKTLNVYPTYNTIDLFYDKYNKIFITRKLPPQKAKKGGSTAYTYFV
jgi:hypothetical protein